MLTLMPAVKETCKSMQLFWRKSYLSYASTECALKSQHNVWICIDLENVFPFVFIKIYVHEQLCHLKLLIGNTLHQQGLSFESGKCNFSRFVNVSTHKWRKWVWGLSLMSLESHIHYSNSRQMTYFDSLSQTIKATQHSEKTRKASESNVLLDLMVPWGGYNKVACSMIFRLVWNILSSYLERDPVQTTK